MRHHTTFILLLAAILLGTCILGCGDDRGEKREADFDQRIREKFGKGYDELDEVTLVIISPHNKDIREEFESSFSLHHALEHGKRVKIEFRDVGGGGKTILQNLRNVYEQSPDDTSGIDIYWGGGEDNFIMLAEEGLLKKMTMPAEAKANIPATFCGLPMYGPEGHWSGVVLGGFGMLYNRQLIRDVEIGDPPKTWDDLGQPRFYGYIGMADPTQSSSANSANEMIIQAGEDWPSGWAKLMSILGNVKQFYDGSSAAANAVLTEVPVATCIDFYGRMRVMKYPGQLTYLAPRGQSVYNPDPIAILKNPPHPELAQRFVDFVLSTDGQALWALPVGAEKGPVKEALYRQPIRKDIYDKFGEEMLDVIENPYAAETELKLNVEMKELRRDILPQLVKAAAVDNLERLRAAKKKLIDTNFDRDRLAVFNELPENVRTPEALAETASKFDNDVEREKIISGWERYFADKYERVAE